MVYGRITLLILTIAMFAGMWSSDQPGNRHAYLARKTGRIQHWSVGRLRPQVRQAHVQRQMERQSLATGWKRTAAPMVKVVSHSRRASQNGNIEKEILTGIPGDLSVGTYRVVDNMGRVGSVTVTREWLRRNRLPEDLPAREMYVRQTSTTCWYWIRVADSQFVDDMLTRASDDASSIILR